MAAVVDGDLKYFIEHDGSAVLIATRDAGLLPTGGWGWAPRVLDGGKEVEVFIDTRAGAQMLANLRSNQHIAMNSSCPISIRSVQLKGWVTSIDPPAPEDADRIEQHRQGFTESVRARGLPAHVSRTLWSKDVTKVRFTVEDCYDQTPGPRAGNRI